MLGLVGDEAEGPELLASADEVPADAGAATVANCEVGSVLAGPSAAEWALRSRSTTVVRDSKELTYAWRTYGDQRIRQVSMRQLMENAQGPVRVPMTNTTGDESTIDDVTGQMIDSPVTKN